MRVFIAAWSSNHMPVNNFSAYVYASHFISNFLAYNSPVNGSSGVDVARWSSRGFSLHSKNADV